MATQARSVLQDQNVIVDIKGNAIKESTRVLRSKKNAPLIGRKALADLSNSTKPCANNAKSKIYRPTGVPGKIGAYKSTSPVGGKISAPDSGKQSLLEGSKKEFSTKLNAFDKNVKAIKAQSPARGKIKVFVEPSDSEHSLMLQTQKRNKLVAELGEISVSNMISSSNEGMPLTCSTKSKEENIVQKLTSSSKGLKPFVQQSVDSHICNAKWKVGGRKALADISNSSSTNVQQASRVSHSNLKAIADEQFLHDHQQCINIQKAAMDMNSIWKMLGLDNGPSQSLPSAVLSDEVKDKIETPFKKCQDLDLTELQVEVQTPYRCTNPLLEDCLSSPESVTSPVHWNYDMSPKFTLVDTPFEK